MTLVAGLPRFKFDNAHYNYRRVIRLSPEISIAGLKRITDKTGVTAQLELFFNQFNGAKQRRGEPGTIDFGEPAFFAFPVFAVFVVSNVDIETD